MLYAMLAKDVLHQPTAQMLQLSSHKAQGSVLQVATGWWFQTQNYESLVVSRHHNLEADHFLQLILADLHFPPEFSQPIPQRDRCVNIRRSSSSMVHFSRASLPRHLEATSLVEFLGRSCQRWMASWVNISQQMGERSISSASDWS